MDDADQFGGGLIAFATRRAVEDVRVEMLLQDLGHQPVERAARRRDELQRLTAPAFVFEGALDGFTLTANATHASEEFRFAPNDVSHGVICDADTVLPYPIIARHAGRMPTTEEER
jgi:hypothetical protein